MSDGYHQYGWRDAGRDGVDYAGRPADALDYSRGVALWRQYDALFRDLRPHRSIAQGFLSPGQRKWIHPACVPHLPWRYWYGKDDEEIVPGVPIPGTLGTPRAVSFPIELLEIFLNKFKECA
jgi:hypothetical protein